MPAQPLRLLRQGGCRKTASFVSAKKCRLTTAARATSHDTMSLDGAHGRPRPHVAVAEEAALVLGHVPGLGMDEAPDLVVLDVLPRFPERVLADAARSVGWGPSRSVVARTGPVVSSAPA